MNDKSNIIESFEKKKDIILSEISYGGYFVILSSEKMSAKDAIITYRSRDNIEKFFFSVKSGMDFDRPRVHNDKRLSYKVYLIFLSGIIRQEILNASIVLKESLKNRKDYTIPSIIDITDNLECISNSSNLYERRYALSLMQKTIFNQFEIDEKYIDRCIENFNNEDTNTIEFI